MIGVGVLGFLLMLVYMAFRAVYRLITGHLPKRSG